MKDQRPYFTVPEHMKQVVDQAIADYLGARRAVLQSEMNHPGTDHRRRDVLAGALAELDYLEGKPEAPAKPAQPARSLYR